MTTTKMYTIELKTQQQNYVHYKIVDTAGNEQTYTAGPYKVDTTAPAPVFKVPEKELTPDQASSVILRGHSAAVAVSDFGVKKDSVNKEAGNTKEDHVSGIEKLEYIWLPSRIGIPENTGSNVSVPEDALAAGDLPHDDGGNAEASGIPGDGYNWQEFTNGATIVQGGKIDGTWNLWVRLTDKAGNVRCYNQSHTGTYAGQKPYPAYRFDNEAPNLPEKDGKGLPVQVGNTSYINNKTYGTLDVTLSVNDENYDNSNSGLDEYQYAFTTTQEAPDNSGLPVFKFDNLTDFLFFDGSTCVNVGGNIAADLKESTGVTFAAEVAMQPRYNSNESAATFENLLHLKGAGDSTVFKVAIAEDTGAIVLTDSAGSTKHLGGEYNDGRVHKIAVSAGYDGSAKVYADGKYLGRFWFPNITKDNISSVTIGERFHGSIFSASLFGRVADDDEGKSFTFRTDDIVGDYVFCTGIEGNVSSSEVTDRSGQENPATVTSSGGWTQEYVSYPFLVADGNLDEIDLSAYADAWKKAENTTVSIGFRADKKNDLMMLFDDGGMSIFLEAGETKELKVGITDNNAYQSITTGRNLNDEKMHTVTVTCMEDTVYVYVDGLLVTTKSDNLYKQYQENRKKGKLGQKITLAENVSGAYPFSGKLYHAYLFGRALTTEEIESGNINFTDSPIALLNFAQDQPGGYNSIPQTGTGIRFDDSGDYVDIGTVQGLIGSSQNIINKDIENNGITASVRFSADKVKKTGTEWSSDKTAWYNSDDMVGQRLLTLKQNSDVASLIALGVYGDGSETVFAYWRASGEQQILKQHVDGLFEGEHYLTMSYAADTNMLTLYMDGVELISEKKTNLETIEDGAQALIGGYLPPEKYPTKYPEGSGQFYGTIYDVNLKSEPTDLATHIKEAREKKTYFTDGKLIAAYDLKETEGDTLTVTEGTKANTTVKVHGIGDASLKLGNHAYYEFSKEGLTDPAPFSFEVTVSAEDISQGIVMAQSIPESVEQAAITYERGKGYRFRFYSMGTDVTIGRNGTDYYNAQPGEKVRLTVTHVPHSVGGNTHIKFYANGRFIGACNGDVGWEDALRIGTGFDTDFNPGRGRYFAGNIYDVKVWNTCLTPEQVAGTEGYDPDSLQVHYDFAGTGDNVLKDKSGHGHNATAGKNTDNVYVGVHPKFDGTARDNSSGYLGSGFTAPAGILSGSADTIRVRLVFQLDKAGGKGCEHILTTNFTGETYKPFRYGVWSGGGGHELIIPNPGDTMNSYYQNSIVLETGHIGSTVKMEKPTVMDYTIDYTHNEVYGTLNGKAFSYKPTTVLNKNGFGASKELLLGYGYDGNSNIIGTLYEVSLWENGDLRVSYKDEKIVENGKWYWKDESGNNFHAEPNNPSASSEITWVPTPGNITGQYPEFMGTGQDYAASPEGTVSFDAGAGPITFKMKYKPLEAYTTTGDTDTQQNYLGIRGIRNDIYSDGAPFFLLGSGTGVRSLLTGSGSLSHTYSSYMGSPNIKGNCDLELTFDPTAALPLTYTGKWNGKAFTMSSGNAADWPICPTNGQVLIAYRDYPKQNGHMLLYDLEIIQNGVTKAHYDGTRSFDGSKLIDVSGHGRDAEIFGNVVWHTEGFEAGDEPEVIPVSGHDLKWLYDQLAKSGDEVISVTNSTVQGKVYLYVWLRDKEGNERQVTYGPFDYDTTRPEISVSARRPKGGETATSGYLSIQVSDNWQLVNEHAAADGSGTAHTRWTVVETSGKTDSPASLFTSASWKNFSGISASGETLTTSVSVPNHELTNITGSTPKKYYVAVEAVDWLGNTSIEYLYVDEKTLFNDATPPVIKLTNIGKADTDAKSHAVQVDVEDNKGSGAGESATGVNSQTLQYVWSQNTTAPGDGWKSFTNHNVLRLTKGSGTWYLHVKASDNAGNAAMAMLRSDAQMMDNTAPAINLARKDSAWQKESSLYTGTVTDAHSGVDKVFYAAGERTAGYFAGAAENYAGLDDATKAVIKQLTATSGKYSFTATELGAYTVYAVDKAGNEKIQVYTEEKIDKTPPTVTLNPASAALGKDNVTVTVTVKDAGGSKIKSPVEYKVILNGAETEKELTINENGVGTITLSSTGTNILQITAFDNAGNTSGVVEGTYVIDKGQNEISITPKTTGVQKSHSAEVTVNETTSGNKASKVSYGWSTSHDTEPVSWNAAQLDSANKFTVTKEGVTGEYYLWVKAESASGVSVTQKKGPFVFNNTLPEEPELTIDQEGWTNQPLPLIVTLKSEGEEVVVRKKGDTQPIVRNEAGEYMIPENGEYEIEVTDEAGNTTTVPLSVTNIDKTEPTVTLSPTPAEGEVLPSLNLSASAKDEDGGSGVKEIKYEVTLPNGDKETYADPAEISGNQDGKYHVKVTVTDNAGNTNTDEQDYEVKASKPAEVSAELTTRLEDDAPVITVKPSGVSEGDTVTITVKDMEGNEVPVTQTKNADGTFTVKGEKLNPNQKYTVTTTVTDKAGNETSDTGKICTLAQLPGIDEESIKIGLKGFSASLIPGENRTDPYYAWTVYTKNDDGTTTELCKIPAENQDFDTDLVGSFNPKPSEGDKIYIDVTAYNQDGKPSGPVTFLLTGEDGGEGGGTGGSGTALNVAPKFIEGSISAEPLIIGAGKSFTLTGKVEDANKDPITVTAQIGGVTKSVVVDSAEGGADFTLTWSNSELREGSYETIVITADDNKQDGKTTTDFTAQITVDKTAPLPPKAAADAGWQQKASITVSPADADIKDDDSADIAGYEYSTDGGTTWISVDLADDTETPYTVTISPECDPGTSVTVLVRAVDEAGNKGRTTQRILQVDGSVPTVTVDVDGADDSWKNEPVKIKVSYADDALTQARWILIKEESAEDELSLDELLEKDMFDKMAKAELAADSQTAEAEVTVTNEGTWYLYALAKDKAGNTNANYRFGPYRLDLTPPEAAEISTEQEEDQGLTITPDNLGGEAASDGLSQIKEGETKYYYQEVQNGKPVDEPKSSEDKVIPKDDLKANASYDLWVSTMDNAGNTAEGAHTNAVTRAQNPDSVTLKARGKDFLLFEINGSDTNANPPEYQITVVNAEDENQAVTSKWSTSGQVRIPLDKLMSGQSYSVKAYITTRNMVDVENTRQPLDKTSLSGTGTGGVDENGIISSSSAPEITLDEEQQDEKILYAMEASEEDRIVLRGTVSDADGGNLIVSASINNIEKTYEITDAVPGTPAEWELSWDVSEDNLCKGTFGSFTDIKVTVMDEDENSASVEDSRVYVIDNAGPKAPETAKPGPASQIKGALKGNADEDNSLLITFKEGVDNGAAGIASWHYVLDDGEEQSGEGSTLPDITVTGDGEHTFKAWYVDACGNVGQETTCTFTLDTKPPVLQQPEVKKFDESTEEGWTEPEPVPGTDPDDKWYDEKIQVTIDTGEPDGEEKKDKIWYVVTDSSDPISSSESEDPGTIDKAKEFEAIKERSEGENGTAGEDAPLQVELENPGEYYIHVATEDEAGNKEVEVYGPYRIDKDLNEDSLVVAVDSREAAKSHSGEITFTHEDEGAPLVSAEYAWSMADTFGKVADTEWTDLTELEAEEGRAEAELKQAAGAEELSGTYYLYARIRDAAGNEVVKRSDSVLVDNTVPNLSLAGKETAKGKPTQYVTVLAEDAHSSVAQIRYLPGSHQAEDFAGDKGELVEETEVMLPKEGIYTFYAVDEAGNETVQEYELKDLDLDAPVITAEGKADTWHKEPFTVTLHFTDTDGITEIGFIDPRNYSISYDEEDTDNGSTQPYMTLPDINTLLPDDAEEINKTFFTTVAVGSPAAAKLGLTPDDEGGYTLEVLIGGKADNTDHLYYDGNGKVMLHAAAVDAAGNVTNISFGPYCFDDTPPEMEMADETNPDMIYVNLVSKEEYGQAHFDGYTMKDNLTTAFTYYEQGQPKKQAPGEGAYTIIYDEDAVNGFTEEGRYEDAIRFVITDAAGNEREFVKDLVVQDIMPPVYGDDEKVSGSGSSYTNYINVNAKENAKYTFKKEDFEPKDVPNALHEPSGLKSITLTALPSCGTLYYQGKEVTQQDLRDRDEDGIPKWEIPMSDIENGELVYEPDQDWYGTDSAMKFLATDNKDRRSSDITKATTVLIKVVEVNDPPVIVYQDGENEVVIEGDETLPKIDTNDNEKYTFTFKVKDPDTDPADLTVKADSDGEASCKVIKNPDGSYTLEVTPKLNEADHEEEIKVTISDGISEIQLTIPVEIAYVEKTVKAVPDGARTGEEGSVLIDVLKNDQLPDPAKRQITGIKVSDPANGKAEAVQADGSWKVRYTAAGNSSGDAAGKADQFTYTIVLEGGSLDGDVLQAKVFINQEGKPQIEVKPGKDSDADWKKEEGDDGTEIWRRQDDDWGKQDEIEISVKPDPAGGDVPVAEVTVLDDKGNVVTKWSLDEGDTPDGDGTVTIDQTITEKGDYTIIVKDICGNETIQKIVEDRIDKTPPSVDLSDVKTTKNDEGDTVISGIHITDEGDDPDDSDEPGGEGPSGEGSGGSGIDPDDPDSIKAVVGDPGEELEIKREEDGSYTIILPEGKNPEDAKITIKDKAGNESSFIVDLVKPLLGSMDAQENAGTLNDMTEKASYLPVVVNFRDYIDELLTKPGTVVSIFVAEKSAEGEANEPSKAENVKPSLPRFSGEVTLIPAVKPYVSGGENVTKYRLIAKDAAGNTQEYEVVIGNIPSPESITKDNMDEVEDILDEIKKQIEDVRPGIDAPEEECERIKDALEDARKKLEELRRPQGGGSGGGDGGHDDDDDDWNDDDNGGNGGSGSSGGGPGTVNGLTDGDGTGTDGDGQLQEDGTGNNSKGGRTQGGTGSGNGSDSKDGTEDGNESHSQGGGAGSGDGSGSSDGTVSGNSTGEKSGEEDLQDDAKDRDGQNAPFILLSALLALAAAAIALMTFLKKKYSGKWKVTSLAAALISGILFFITTGWHGIRFADISTIPVAVFAIAAAAAAYAASRQDEESEEEE